MSGNESMSRGSHRGLGAVMFGERCALCGLVGPSPCPSCALRLPRPPSLELPASIDAVVALTAYEDSGKALVKSFKFANQRSSIDWAARELADRLRHAEVEAVTWIPSSFEGLTARGFDPGELLAVRVARSLGIAPRRCLRRSGIGRQGLRDVTHRRSGPGLHVPWHVRRMYRFARIAIVDDVSTTGSSLTAAAELLRHHVGVRFIVGAVVARTPVAAPTARLPPTFGGVGHASSA